MNYGGTTDASAGVTGISATSYQVTLMEFAFNNSLGKPFVSMASFPRLSWGDDSDRAELT